MMAKTMTAANQVPHFGYNDEVIMDKLLELKKEFKKIAEKRGIKLTNMPIILKATSLALKSFPILNSTFDAEKNLVTYKSAHNIGIAMDTPNGLIVPNVKNVQSKSVLEIAEDLNRLQNAALNASVSREDLTGGTFTLSNIGAIGGTTASPLLVVPEVAIGALGKIQKLPRYDAHNNVVPMHLMCISWAADHR
jgi:2-oxoisovalerate dehydrogenase E2 component (dihydrolipoyl transacylase)